MAPVDLVTQLLDRNKNAKLYTGAKTFFQEESFEKKSQTRYGFSSNLKQGYRQMIDRETYHFLHAWFDQYVDGFAAGPEDVQKNIILKKKHSERVRNEIIRIGKTLGLGTDARHIQNLNDFKVLQIGGYLISTLRHHCSRSDPADMWH